MLNVTAEQLKPNQAQHTTKEIYQQPEVWKESIELFLEQQETYQTFLQSIYEKHEHVRVIFSGAGTSAFVGDTLVPELSRQHQGKVTFESIATTDIVSNPTQFLHAEQPTILVSFARSGNSPESVATVALGEELIKDFYQVVITCNKDGKLAKNIEGDPNSITLLMPEKSNDQSLAMTSSFSTMILSAYALFASEDFTPELSTQLTHSGEKLLETLGDDLDEIVAHDFDRIVYLGSGLLSQLSHEAALKMLELSNGEVVSLHESSLGFRHGPKSILTGSSFVMLFVSSDPYTRKYDIDILRELSAAETGMKIVVVAERAEKELSDLADWVIPVNVGEKDIPNDFLLGLLYVIVAQSLALKKSLQLGITPDNPSPDGAINRVVQGVTIYDYEG